MSVPLEILRSVDIIIFVKFLIVKHMSILPSDYYYSEIVNKKFSQEYVAERKLI